jgi:hypothetical protein
MTTYADPLTGRVRLSCKAVVAGEKCEVSLIVAAPVYDDPISRDLVSQQLRRALMDKILEKWTPVIHVQR